MKKLRKIRMIFFAIALIWIVTFIFFAIFGKQEHLQHVYSMALEKAKGSVDKDKLLRSFISDVGGVYVPVSDEVQPNPYLNLPDKNIETKDGQTLTLLNPDYFTRIYYKHSNIGNKHTKISLVSLDPINKANMPNEWERKALLKVKENNQAFVEIVNKNNTSEFKYMSPLIMKENCMKCHGNSDVFAGTNNYKPGEVAGGLSVTLDYKPYLSLANSQFRKAFIPVLLLFSVGLIIFFIFYKLIKKLTIEAVESSNKYMSLFNNLPVGSIYLDSNGNILETNRTFAEIMGSSVNKINKLNINDLNSQKVTDAFNEALTSDSGLCEGWYTSVTGNKTIYAKGLFESVYDEKGNISSVLAVIEDSTESYYREKELEKLANIYRDSINEIYIFDADSFRFIDANKSALKNIGYTMDVIKQLTPLDIKLDINKEDFEQILKPLKTGEKKKVAFSAYHYRSDGSKYPVEIHLQLMEFEKPVFVAYAYDVTEKKEMESRFENIFNFIDDSIRILDTEGNILNINRQGLKQYGYSFEEITKMNIKDIRTDKYSPNVNKDIADIMKKGSAIYELEHKRKDGSVFPVEINATYIQYEGKPAILAVARDITKRKKTEKEREELTSQITQTQKLESVGQLAGGIAHDFNNFLAGIMAYIDILVRSKNLDKNEKEYLSHMMQLSERSAKLVQNMMAFSRKQASIPQVVDINNQLGINKRLYKKMIKENISFTVNYCSQPVYVNVDPIQLDQVVLNLISNARDAIEESGNISITVSKTSSSDLINHCEAVKPESNDYCLIEVTDDGSGMDEETAKRIFEPFFTTKEKGYGTGFGLATTYGIIKQNKGYIFCESEAGKGTKFLIYLPSYEGDFAESSQLDDESSKGDLTRIKGKKILFCEDDASVRKVISKMLTSSGFDIIEAVDGDDALARFKENIDDICCVVSDNVTPKKSGIDLYEDIVEIKPNIRFVMISGYSADTEKMTDLQRNKNFRFLQKPIKPTLLKKTIVELTEEGDD